MTASTNLAILGELRLPDELEISTPGRENDATAIFNGRQQLRRLFVQDKSWIRRSS